MCELQSVLESEKKYSFKIDLAPSWLPYKYSLYKNMWNKWYPIQNNNSITLLEEEIKQMQDTPLYYE